MIARVDALLVKAQGSKAKLAAVLRPAPCVQGRHRRLQGTMCHQRLTPCFVLCVFFKPCATRWSYAVASSRRRLHHLRAATPNA